MGDESNRNEFSESVELAAVVDDVRQGLLDIAAGKGESIQDVMASIRVRLREKS